MPFEDIRKPSLSLQEEACASPQLADKYSQPDYVHSSYTCMRAYTQNHAQHVHNSQPNVVHLGLACAYMCNKAKRTQRRPSSREIKKKNKGRRRRERRRSFERPRRRNKGKERGRRLKRTRGRGRRERRKRSESRCIRMCECIFHIKGHVYMNILNHNLAATCTQRMCNSRIRNRTYLCHGHGHGHSHGQIALFMHCTIGIQLQRYVKSA